MWGAGIVAAAFVVGVMVSGSRTRAGLLVGVLALDAVALFVVPELSAPRNVKIDLAPVSYLRQHLGTSRFFTLGPVTANYGSYFGIALLDFNDIPVPTLLSDYVSRHLDPTAPPVDFDAIDNPSPELELIDNVAGYRAAGVATCLPPSGLSLPRSAGFTLVFKGQSAWIYRLAGSQPYFTAKGCNVGIQSRTSVRLVCPRAATLVRRETSMPGWSAQINGNTTMVHTVDGIFQGVAVGAGEHRVTFSFTPPHESLGLVAFVIGLAWLVCVVADAPERWRGLLQRRRGPAAPSDH